MTEPPPDPPAADGPGPAPDGAEPAASDPAAADPDESYAALRALIVAPEQVRLAALERRLDVAGVRAEELAAVLPAALRLGAEDPRLAESLEPVVARGFDAFIEAGEARVVEALTPVMGALIRQWVARELKTRLAELTRLLDQSLSPRSLAWRVEALVTRRPYGEVALLRTLAWRVVRVLLIHGETGILLRHVSAARGDGGAVEQAPDVVSSMLTAVQSYLHDGFGAAEGEAVDAIEIGDKTVWIENTARAVLAVELAGLPDPGFRGAISEAMEAIDQRAHRRLVEFEGDVDAFADVDPVLRGLVDRSPSPPPPRLWPSLAALALVLAAIGGWAWQAWRAEARWDAVLAALAREPGVVVVEVVRDGRAGRVEGLRDPRAADPDAIAAAHGLPAEHWQADFEPYHAHHPPFVLARAHEALEPPPGVELVFADGTLAIRGHAPSGWWSPRRAAAAALAGVQRVDVGGLTIEDDRLARARLLLDPPSTVAMALDGETLRVSGEAPAEWLASAARRGPSIAGIAAVDASGAADALEAARRRVEAVEIEFAPDVAELTAAGERQLAQTLDDMVRLRRASPWLRFVVLGHADASGSARRNAELRRARADAVAERLLAEPRLSGAVLRRPAAGSGAVGRVARIRVEVP